MSVFATSGMLLSYALFVFLIYNANSFRSRFLVILAFVIAFCLTGSYIEIIHTEVEVAKVGFQLRVLAEPYIPTLWFFCVWEFCGRRFSRNIYAAFFWIIPALSSLLFFSWEQNLLLVQSVHFTSAGIEGNLVIEPGPLHIVYTLYQIGINLLGLFTLAYSYRNGTRHFKRQSLLFVISTFIPFFDTISYYVTINHYHINLSPYLLLLSMILFSFSLYAFGMLNSSHIIKDEALNNLPQAILLFDENGVFAHANNAAKELFPPLKSLPLAASVEEMPFLPVTPKELSGPPRNLSEYTCDIGGASRTYNVSSGCIYRNKKIIGYSLTFSNITPLKDSLTLLEEKSITDPLTAIYNRAYWFERGATIFEEARQTNHSYSIIMFDIDHFKKVNDTYGHVYGDTVLQNFAMIASGKLRKSDVFARYGGEEFCILLQADYSIALQKADKIREAISEHPFSFNNKPIQITASFGVAAWMPEDHEFLDCVRRADHKLYQAKQTGRNKVC